MPKRLGLLLLLLPRSAGRFPAQRAARDQREQPVGGREPADPGRGGALVYELDDAGNRIPDPDADKHKDEAGKFEKYFSPEPGEGD